MRRRIILTLTWQPPSALKSVWGQLFVSKARDEWALPRATTVPDFMQQADYLVYLLRGMLAVARPLTTNETLNYLHSCVSDRWHPVELPQLPVDLDVMLCDTPFYGGWYPRLGRWHLRVCSIHSYPPRSIANTLHALNHLRFPYRWSTRWIAMERQTQEHLLVRGAKAMGGAREGRADPHW